MEGKLGKRKVNIAIGKMPVSSSSVGIIYPPPEIRKIVDKTALFVARNGKEFEERIKESESGDSKFNFLKPDNIYHAYYLVKISEGNSAGDEPLQKIEENKIAVSEILQSKPKTKKSYYKRLNVDWSKMSAFNKEEESESVEKFNFILNAPSGLSSMEVDVIKTTAQFAARRGKTFVQNLASREQKNLLFDFLKPQHAAYRYFHCLVSQYELILAADAKIIANLKRSVENSKVYLNDTVEVLSFMERYAQNDTMKQMEEIERERLAFSQIDWHDFVVVETVVFKDEERDSLPDPVTLETLGLRVIQQNRGELLEPDQPEVKVEAVEKVEPDEISKIRQSTTMLISPITNEPIPADMFDHHMKVALLDPKWREQKTHMMTQKKMQEQVYISGTTISENLRNIAEKRSDIFGPSQKGDFVSVSSKGSGQTNPVNTNIDEIKINVKVPFNEEMSRKNNFDLSGQVLTFSMKSTDKIALLKQKIAAIDKMPPANKQKLFIYKSNYLSDDSTLGSLNISNNFLQLVISKSKGKN